MTRTMTLHKYFFFRLLQYLYNQEHLLIVQKTDIEKSNLVTGLKCSGIEHNCNCVGIVSLPETIHLILECSKCSLRVKKVFFLGQS